MKPTRLAGLAVGAALVVAGCGGSDGGYRSGPGTQSSKPPTATPSAGRTAVVTMENVAFKPETLTARVGQTVRWTNQDGVPHDVKALRGADFRSKILQPGQSYSTKLDRAANIVYVCTIHPNMKASIRVLE